MAAFTPNNLVKANHIGAHSSHGVHLEQILGCASGTLPLYIATVTIISTPLSLDLDRKHFTHFFSAVIRQQPWPLSPESFSLRPNTIQLSKPVFISSHSRVRKTFLRVIHKEAPQTPRFRRDRTAIERFLCRLRQPIGQLLCTIYLKRSGVHGCILELAPVADIIFWSLRSFRRNGAGREKKNLEFSNDQGNPIQRAVRCTTCYICCMVYAGRSADRPAPSRWSKARSVPHGGGILIG